MAPSGLSGLALACVVAWLAAAASAQNLQVPIFSEPGAPPFLDSVIYGYTSGPGADAPKGEINRAGVISAGRFTYTKYTASGPTTQMGEYDSWECVDPDGSPGAYRAVVYVTVSTPDIETGNLVSELRVYCEYGEVDPERRIQKWAWSEDPSTCPNITERINYRDWTAPRLNYSCGVPGFAETYTGLDIAEDETVTEETAGGFGPEAFMDFEGDGEVNAIDEDDDGDGVTDDADPDDNGDGLDEDVREALLGQDPPV